MVFSNARQRHKATCERCRDYGRAERAPAIDPCEVAPKRHQIPPIRTRRFGSQSRGVGHHLSSRTHL